MKKIISYTLIGAFAFSFAAVALADTSANARGETGTSSAIKQIEKLKEVRDNAKADIKANLRMRAENKLDRMSVRLEATIAREINILARINSRIAKIKSAGGNTAASEKFALEAQTNLDLATTSLATFEALADTVSVQDTASSTTLVITRDHLAKLRASAAVVITDLRKAHKAMANAIINLKGESSVHATTSAEVKVNVQ